MKGIIFVVLLAFNFTNIKIAYVENGSGIHLAPVISAEDVSEISLEKIEQVETEYEISIIEKTLMYITRTVNVRSIPDPSGKLITTLYPGDEVNIVGFVESNTYNKNQFYVTEYNGFINANYISCNKPVGTQLNVENIMQNPELPNGCEITSLTICMNYKGYAADKCDMSDNYLPKWPDLSGDPEYYYLREPRSNGFYCFAPCLCSAVDNYNAVNGTEISYSNLTGSTVSALYEQIDNQNPVIVWGTLRWNAPYKYSNGLYSNLHCMVLSGYTDSTVTIVDPIYGDKYRIINRALFETVWTQMGSRALVIY